MSVNIKKLTALISNAKWMKFLKSRDLEKGVAHKYISKRKVNGKWSYTYADTKNKKAGLSQSEEINILKVFGVKSHARLLGAKISVGEGYKLGKGEEVQVVGSANGKVTFKTEVGGKIQTVKKQEFISMVVQSHTMQAMEYVEMGIVKREDILDRATTVGDPKTIKRAKKLLEEFKLKHGKYIKLQKKIRKDGKKFKYEKQSEGKAVRETLSKPTPMGDRNSKKKFEAETKAKEAAALKKDKKSLSDIGDRMDDAETQAEFNKDYAKYQNKQKELSEKHGTSFPDFKPSFPETQKFLDNAPKVDAVTTEQKKAKPESKDEAPKGRRGRNTKDANTTKEYNFKNPKASEIKVEPIVNGFYGNKASTDFVKNANNTDFSSISDIANPNKMTQLAKENGFSKDDALKSLQELSSFTGAKKEALSKMMKNEFNKKINSFFDRQSGKKATKTTFKNVIKSIRESAAEEVIKQYTQSKGSDSFSKDLADVRAFMADKKNAKNAASQDDGFSKDLADVRAFMNQRTEKKESKKKSLPELKGSEKQVKWASDIRNKHVESMKEALSVKELGMKKVDGLEWSPSNSDDYTYSEGSSLKYMPALEKVAENMNVNQDQLVTKMNDYKRENSAEYNAQFKSKAEKIFNDMVSSNATSSFWINNSGKQGFKEIQNKVFQIAHEAMIQDIAKSKLGDLGKADKKEAVAKPDKPKEKKKSKPPSDTVDRSMFSKMFPRLGTTYWDMPKKKEQVVTAYKTALNSLYEASPNTSHSTLRENAMRIVKKNIKG